MSLKGSNKTEYQREYMKRKRAQGLTAEGVKSQGLTAPEKHLVAMLLDPVKRKKLQGICDAFADSHYPEYIHGIFMGQVCFGNMPGLLQATASFV